MQTLLGLLTDLQLSLNASLAALPVVRLSGVVLRHHLDKFTGQRGVLMRQRETTKHFTGAQMMLAVDGKFKRKSKFNCRSEGTNIHKWSCVLTKYYTLITCKCSVFMQEKRANRAYKYAQSS